MRADAMNRVSTFFLQINLVSHCYWMLCSVGCLQIPMTGRRIQTGAATVVRLTRAPLSVARVRRFRFTRAPLPFHACAAVRFTRAPLPVDVCRPDIAFSTRSFFLAERACVPAVFWCGFPEKHCTGFCSSRMSDYLCCILLIAQIQSYSDGGLTLMQI